MKHPGQRMAQIEFSDEQAMLLAMAADFCSTHSPIATVRDLIDTSDGYTAETWREMTELGWLAVALAPLLFDRGSHAL